MNDNGIPLYIGMENVIISKNTKISKRNEGKPMKYVALFRGINVGGKNIVKMADLRQLLLDLGLSKVKTYIQSGNAFFETPLSEDDLLEKIRTGFSGRFGLGGKA